MKRLWSSQLWCFYRSHRLLMLKTKKCPPLPPLDWSAANTEYRSEFQSEVIVPKIWYSSRSVPVSTFTQLDAVKTCHRFTTLQTERGCYIVRVRGVEKKHREEWMWRVLTDDARNEISLSSSGPADSCGSSRRGLGSGTEGNGFSSYGKSLLLISMSFTLHCCSQSVSLSSGQPQSPMDCTIQTGVRKCCLGKKG